MTFFSLLVLVWTYLSNIFMNFFQANRFKNLKKPLRFSLYNLSQGIRVESHALKSMPASKTDYAVHGFSVTVILSLNSDAPMFLKKKKQTKNSNESLSELYAAAVNHPWFSI